MACSVSSNESRDSWSLLKSFKSTDELQSFLTNDLYRSASYQTNQNIKCTLCNNEHKMKQQLRKCCYIHVESNGDSDKKKRLKGKKNKTFQRRLRSIIL